MHTEIKTLVDHPETLREILKLKQLDGLIRKAGWDVAINENGEPVVVEINFRNPVIQVAQMLTGPFFKERTREVIDYAIAHPFRSFTDELLH